MRIVFFFLLLFSLLASTLNAQPSTYRTVKVRGTIILTKTGQRLRKNVKFNAKEALKFSAKTDALVVVDENAGTYLLTPDTTMRKYRLKPLSISLDSRHGNILSDPQLRQFFEQNDTLLLLNGSFSLLLGKGAFPMNDKHLFYLQYTWKGQQINKMLPYSGDTLFIQADSVFQVDKIPIDPASVSSPFYLFYFYKDTKVSVAYPAKGVPIYLMQESENALRGEIETLLDALQITDREQGLLVAANYLTALYGRPGEPELWRWLH